MVVILTGARQRGGDPAAAGRGRISGRRTPTGHEHLQPRVPSQRRRGVLRHGRRQDLRLHHWRRLVDCRQTIHELFGRTMNFISQNNRTYLAAGGERCQKCAKGVHVKATRDRVGRIFPAIAILARSVRGFYPPNENIFLWQLLLLLLLNKRMIIVT